MKSAPRSLLSLPLVLFVASIAGACAGPDPGSEIMNRAVASGAGGASPDDPSPDAGAPGLDGAAAPPSPTTPPAVDAGSPPAPDAAAAPVNAFTGAPAYVATTGRSARKSDHGNGGNPARLACLTCHRAGGNAPRWFAGGTVFTSAQGTTPAPRVEVRLRDATGKAVSTYTDADGNFYVTPTQAQGLAFPLQIGARDGTTVRPMSASITSGDCASSGCHGGTPGVVHVP